MPLLENAADASAVDLQIFVIAKMRTPVKCLTVAFSRNRCVSWNYRQIRYKFPSESGRPFPCGAVFVRHPRFGSNEAPALNAPRAIELRTHLADREPLFTLLSTDRFPAAGRELDGRGSERLRHRPDAWISGRSLTRRWWLLDRWRRSLADGHLDRLWRRWSRRSNLNASAVNAASGDVDRPKQLTPVLGHSRCARSA